MPGPKAVILGLDGATLRLVEPWARSGLLPNLAGLMSDGSSGILRSTVPATTPLAWPSIFTGCGPGKHGIFGFYKRTAGSYAWTKSSRLDLRRPPIWDILGVHGLRSGVFFVPYTFPAYAIHGVMVTGRGGATDLDARISHPPGLAAELAARFGRLAVVGKPRSVENVLEDVAHDLEAAVRGKTDVIAHLVAREPLDFVFAVWDHTDTVAHLFWHHTHLPLPDESSPVFRIYKAVDDGIGKVLEAAGGDPIVMVCSDHGTYPVRYRVRMAPWLESAGFLQIAGSAQDKALRAAATASKKVPDRLRGMLPVRQLRRVKRRFQPTVEKAFDWPATRVYPQPATAESLYVNMVGREPSGAVERSQLRVLLDELSDSLLRASAPTGERFVDAVHRGADAYTGSQTGNGPDLVVEARRGFMLAPSRVGEKEIFWEPPLPRIEHDPPRSICYHDAEGMVIVRGPGVRSGTKIDAHCTDVVPTLLALLDLAGPPELDGRPIQVGVEELAYTSMAMDLGDPGVTGSLSAEEERQIEKQLMDLGYVE